MRNEGSQAFVFGIQQFNVPFIHTGVSRYILQATVPPVHCGLPEVHEKIPELLELDDELLLELDDEPLLELDDELLLELDELVDELVVVDGTQSGVLQR